jgi:small conductance mechanosensitive channel
MQKLFTLEFWQSFLTEKDLQDYVHRAIYIASLLIIYLVVKVVTLRLVDVGLQRVVDRQASSGHLTDRANRLRTLQSLCRNLIGYLLIFVFGVMGLHALDINVTGMITAAGVGGLAIGFGAQKLVKDIISGFFLIVEDQFAVGDYITIGDATGTVEEIGLRLTRIRDDFGRLWIISNGDSTVVTNYSRAPLKGFLEIEFPPDVDVPQLKEVIAEVGKELSEQDSTNLLAPPVATGVSAFGALGVTLRVAFTVKPGTMVAEQLRFREALRARLAENGIELRHPFEKSIYNSSTMNPAANAIINPPPKA